MPIIRLSADIEVDKGDPKRLEAALQKKENRALLANFVAHTLVPDVSESVEVSPVGAYVHVHSCKGGPCGVCSSEAAISELPDF